MIESTNGSGTGEAPTSSQQTMQVQPNYENQQSLIQSCNYMPQNHLIANTNGGFPQHIVQGGFFLSGMQPNQGTINAGEIWKSASTCTVNTSNVTNVVHHVNQVSNSLAHGGLNSAQLQHVQAQSHINAQSFQGAPPLQYQPVNQQRKDTNAMPPNVLGIDGGDVLSNKAGQVHQMPSNQPQQSQQFSQLAPPLLATSSSADAKMNMIMQQRRVIQRLELQLKKQSELQRNGVQTNAHPNGSSSSNNSTSLSHPLPFLQTTEQNAPTNSPMELQPQLPQMQRGSFQINMYQSNPAASLPQQIKHSDQEQLSNPKQVKSIFTNDKDTQKQKHVSLQRHTLNDASIGGTDKTLTEQDLRRNETTEVLERNMLIVKDEKAKVNQFSVTPDCDMKTKMIETDEAEASDVIEGSDGNKEQTRGNIPTNVDTQEENKSVSSRLEPDAWQLSNNASDRDRIFNCIFNAINGTKPRGKNISEKLPLMARRLEERLYRCAKSKEDYNDTHTLKKRLQSLIFGMGGSKIEKKKPKVPLHSVVHDSSVSLEAQQKIQQLKQIHRNVKTKINLDQVKSSATLVQSGQFVSAPRNSFTEEERRKNIRKQQHRLLLLRHASKCNAPSCSTPYCSQMKLLWKHMSRCAEIDCKTPHCFSSRCVLNHYRICSKQNLTATCEVCSPLIKRGGGNNHVGRAPKLGHRERRAIVQTSGQKSGGDFKPICNSIDGIVPPKTQSSEAFEFGTNNGKDIINMKSHLIEQKKLQQRFLIMDLKQQQMQLTKKQQSIERQNKFVLPQSEEWHSLQSTLHLSGQYQHELQNQLLQLEKQPNKAEIKHDVVMSDADEHNSEHLSATGNDDLKISPISEGISEHFELKQKSVSLNRGTAEGIKIRSAETSYSLSIPSILKGGQQVKTELSSTSTSNESNQRCDDSSIHTNETPPLSSDTFETSQNTGLQVGSIESGVTCNLPDLISRCMPFIRNLLDDSCGWVFAEPVNPKELGLPDYFDIIKKPMDLSLVKKKLEDKAYHDIGEFKADVLLVFQNAILYNGEDSEVGEIAAKFMTKFGNDFKSKM